MTLEEQYKLTCQNIGECFISYESLKQDVAKAHQHLQSLIDKRQQLLNKISDCQKAVKDLETVPNGND
jgi:chaperonin cofactor prefoldin